MKRTSAYYIFLLGLLGLAIVAVLRLGSHLPAPSVEGAQVVAKEAAAGGSAFEGMVASLRKHLNEPLSHLFVQLLVIIPVSRLFGRLVSAFGQPSVIGEMAAGILLGPSLFAAIAPGAFAFVFPESSFGSLKLLSQVGVCLFMFSVGMELDVRQLRNKAHAAVVVSHASIVVPCFLGVVLAYFLFLRLAQPGTTFLAFALFMGISMSITAFPVLARILKERGLTRTPLGGMAIVCAAVDDVTAWSLLAFVVAIARSSSVTACLWNLALVAGFVGLMLAVVRPLLKRGIGPAGLEAAEPTKGALATVLCVVVAASLCTEVIGIHALFGAFLAGAIMPQDGDFRHKLTVRVENFASVFLLPLFFVFTGLRTRLGLVNDAEGWLLTAGIIAVATAGKLGGTALTARVTGMRWREALQLGALMNTRGLMELIALNIGYDLGILSPRIFTMLVLMALVTTALTGPLLTLFREKEPQAA